MRAKVVAFTVTIAMAGLGVAILLSRLIRQEPVVVAPAALPVAQAVANPPVTAPERTVPATSPPVIANVKPAFTSPPVVQQTNHDAYVQDRVAELMALAMNNDSNSLDTIWSELSNPDKDIRAGALESVVQFGDRSVVPRLRELAAQTADSAEQAAISNAANYLELPSLTEQRQVSATNGTPAR